MNDVKLNETTGGVGLIRKTFQVLDMFDVETPAWSQADLVRKSGMNRSTLSRVVRYLHSSGYLMFNEQNSKYMLGIAAVELGRRASNSFDLHVISGSVVEQLALQEKETVILTSYQEGQGFVTCLDQVHASQGGLSVFEKLGAVFPLHAGASPKAILLALSPDQREDYYKQDLKSFTPATITDPDKLRAHIEEYAARGFAVSREETYPGVIGVAAPIVVNGRPLGSIALSVPIQRTTESKIERWSVLVRKAVQQIADQANGLHLQQEVPLK